MDFWNNWVCRFNRLSRSRPTWRGRGAIGPGFTPGVVTTGSVWVGLDSTGFEVVVLVVLFVGSPDSVDESFSPG